MTPPNKRNFLIFGIIWLLTIISAYQIPHDVATMPSVYITNTISIAFGASGYKLIKEN